MKTKLKAFHGDEKIKEKYIARVKAHAAADEIIKGEYWENGKGCAVGCTVHSDKHSAYETELGIPFVLARLEDRIFEGMSNEKAKAFPLKFLESIEVGADLSLVWPKFAVWLLEDVSKYITTPKPAFDAVVDGYKRIINGESISLEEWLRLKAEAWEERKTAASASAASASAYAAASAASASAYASAASAAYDAYDASAIAYAAAYGAAAAADAASASAAVSAAYDAAAYAAAYAAADVSAAYAAAADAAASAAAYADDAHAAAVSVSASAAAYAAAAYAAYADAYAAYADDADADAAAYAAAAYAAAADAAAADAADADDADADAYDRQAEKLLEILKEAR